jgi:hypothetical protein
VRRGPLGRVASNLRDPLGALVEKELSILRREPAVRSVLIGQAMYPVMMVGFVVVGIVGGRSKPDLARLVPLASLVVYPMLQMEMGLAMNLLGFEGGGALHSMLLPVPRRVLMLGKCVAYLLAFGTLNALVAVAATLVAWAATGAASPSNCALWCLLGAIEGYCALAVGLGIGCFLSVLAPVRLAVRDRRAIRQQAGGREGCLRSLLGLATVFGTLLVCAPVAALFHLPYALHLLGSSVLPPWSVLVTVPAAAALSAAVLWGGAALGGGLLASREEEVVSLLAKSEE